jgi:hypothetical protein
MQVVAQLPLNWVQLRGPDGTFFVNSTTRQVTQDVPAELRQLAQQHQQLPHQQAQPMPQMHGLMDPPQQQMQLPPPNDTPPQVKGRIGDWLICEDLQGMFYRDSRTGETFESPPPELLRLHAQQQQQQQQQQPPPHQLDQQMYQQPVQQMPYPGGGGGGGYSHPYDMPQAYEHQSM